jgi:hypothetical protein
MIHSENKVHVKKFSFFFIEQIVIIAADRNHFRGFFNAFINADAKGLGTTISPPTAYMVYG